jgi:hypothetical protein
MIYPEIRHIHSPDLDPPNLPADPANCEIAFRALIGPKDGEGEEAFDFSVVTAGRLTAMGEGQWGRGKLLLATFEWSAVIHAVAKLLAQCGRSTWGEVVAELNKELFWRSDDEKTGGA